MTKAVVLLIALFSICICHIQEETLSNFEFLSLNEEKYQYQHYMDIAIPKTIYNTHILLKNGLIASGSFKHVDIWDLKDRSVKITITEGVNLDATKLLQLTNGILVVGSYGFISYYDPEQNYKLIKSDQIFQLQINNLLQLKNGLILVSTSYYPTYPETMIKVLDPTNDYKVVDTITNPDNVQTIYELNNGKIVISLVNSSIRIHDSNNKFELLTSFKTEKVANSLLEVNPGFDELVTIQGNHLVIYRENKLYKTIEMDNDHFNLVLLKNNMIAAYTDRGLESHKLEILDPWDNYSREQYLARKYVTHVTELQEGMILASFNDSTMTVWKPIR